MTAWLLARTPTGWLVFKQIGNERISYAFKTEDWARLCQKTMDRMDGARGLT